MSDWFNDPFFNDDDDFGSFHNNIFQQMNKHMQQMDQMMNQMMSHAFGGQSLGFDNSHGSHYQGLDYDGNSHSRSHSHARSPHSQQQSSGPIIEEPDDDDNIGSSKPHHSSSNSSNQNGTYFYSSVMRWKTARKQRM